MVARGEYTTLATLTLISGVIIAGLLIYRMVPTMLKLIDGKKGYSVALGIIATAVGMWFSGDYTLLEVSTMFLNGLGIGAIRHGIAKTEQK